jgi:succinate dehydrogenase / fumarate reductase iron-sulfur subunit
VCPEHINITDNGIIPLKERVVDRYYDPLKLIGRALTGRKVRKESVPYEPPASPKLHFPETRDE